MTVYRGLNKPVRIGLIGYGKAGQAVARVLAEAPGIELAWILKRSEPDALLAAAAPATLAHVSNKQDMVEWLAQHPVEAIVDFSSASTLEWYAHEVCARTLTLVSAISSYSDADLERLKLMGQSTRVLASPNITLGINFLLIAASLLRKVAPFADVEILEQHFKEKPEISGTAKRLAERLELEEGKITSMRLGGVVGHHEVIFGFPHQTVRLTHDAIRREAFGTGVVFALNMLSRRPPGFYKFDELLTHEI